MRMLHVCQQLRWAGGPVRTLPDESEAEKGIEMIDRAPEPDLSNIDDLTMADELAACVDYFDEREKTLIQSGQQTEKLLERLARHKAACRAASRWLRSWNAAGCGKDAEFETLFDKPLADEKQCGSLTSNPER